MQAFLYQIYLNVKINANQNQFYSYLHTNIKIQYANCKWGNLAIFKMIWTTKLAWLVKDWATRTNRGVFSYYNCFQTWEPIKNLTNAINRIIQSFTTKYQYPKSSEKDFVYFFFYLNSSGLQTVMISVIMLGRFFITVSHNDNVESFALRTRLLIELKSWRSNCSNSSFSLFSFSLQNFQNSDKISVKRLKGY